MPHTSHTRHTNSSGDDLGSTDEVKVFKDEGDREDEKISSENLLVEEKSCLIDLTESEEKSAYSYSNGGAGGLPVTMTNKIGLPPFFCHNGDHLTTPPPAHCGIPPYQLDPKAMGLTRPAIFPFPSGQYPYPMLSPDMSQVTSWHTPSVYSAASSFRSLYPSINTINTTLSSDFPFRFSPSLLPSVHTPSHHVLNTHSPIVPSGPKQDCNHDTSANHRYSRNLDNKNSTNLQGTDNCKMSAADKKKSHIKKPLNAFMLYMKEMRAKVVAECTLKESAAINQILGRRWHELSREEQNKYYEKARQERQLHMELYPGWSARDNYGYVSKKKKRKKERSPADLGGINMKKCRARFGLDQQNQWCKPCRRKKKCIRYMEAIGATRDSNNDRYNEEDIDDHHTDDEDESCCSGDDNNQTRNDNNESIKHSMPSPGGLSSLQSPSTSSASPLGSLASSAMSQHVSGLLNSAVSEQLKQHQQHMHVLKAQQQHLNQQLLHQTKLHHHHQSGHLQQSVALTDTFNTISTSTSANEDGLTNVSASVATALFPTLSTSSSSSIYASATSCSTNTSSTSSPACISARMVRSLLSPALFLGNSLTASSAATSTTATTSQNISLPEVTDNITHSSNLPLSPLICSAASSPDAVPYLPETVCANYTCNINNCISHLPHPLQRNPIGANPRDINNPLSINQLTKRPHEESNCLSSCINTSCTTSSLIGSTAPLITGTRPTTVYTTSRANVIFNHLQAHHVTQPTLQLSPSHNVIFRNNFSQHFQQQFGHHLVAAVAAKASTTTNAPQTPRTASNSTTVGSNVTSNTLAVNIDVSRRPSNDKTTTTTTTNESVVPSE